MDGGLIPREDTVGVAGLSVFAGSRDDALAAMARLVEARAGGYVCFTGIHGVAEAQRTKAVMRAHLGASLVVPDGIPLVWVGKARGRARMTQVAGPDMLPRLFDQAAALGWRVFLFGASEHTLTLAARRAKHEHPGIEIVGVSSPPFGEVADWDHESTRANIRASGCDAVFVALSTPKQELWMQHNAKYLGATAFGVGAAMDIYAGVREDAPAWLRGSGLEWAYRTVREPGRLWRRYARAIPVFAWSVAREGRGRPARDSSHNRGLAD